MKKIFTVIMSAVLMVGAMFCLTGCGGKEETTNTTSEVYGELPEENTVAEDEKETTTEATTEDAQGEEAEDVVAGAIDDCPKLTIELKEGTFTYNGESFEDVYQQLTDLGLVTDKAKTKYETEGIFNSGRLEASNGTLFFIDYLSNKKEFIVRTGSGIKDEIAWDIVIGNIDNTMTIEDLIDMGATEVKENKAHSDGYKITDYLLTSTNFETKGVSIKASGDGSPEPEDLVVEGIYVTYTGVEN